jgi:CheY-like chemotaxis protein
MDVQMPVMDGLEATRLIRAMPGRQQVPILAMTASAYAADRQACLAAGMNDHVAKPVVPEDLFAALVKWLPGGSAWQQRSPPAAAVETLPAALAGIPGLDVALGLKGVRGRVASYLRLLRTFRVAHAGDTAAVHEQLAAGRWEDARRLAHSLKGAAGTLGATGLQQAAVALDAALRQEGAAAAVEDCAAALDREWQALSAALARALPEVAEVPAAVVDWPALRATVARLEDLLAEDNMSANAVFLQSRALLRGAFGPEVKTLEARLDAFDYTAALAWLRDRHAQIAAGEVP